MSVARHGQPSPPLRSEFTGFRFPPEVIVLAVGWYLRFGPSHRDVEESRNWRGQVNASAVTFAWASRPAAQVFALVGYAAGPGDPAYEYIEDGMARGASSS